MVTPRASIRRNATGARLVVVFALGIAATLAAAGCDAPSRPPAAPAHTTPAAGGQSASGPAPSAACPPTADVAGLGERQGAADDGATLWALFFPTEPQLKAGQEIKIAWRMTGTGDLSMSATGPDGTVVKPAWGPEEHTGSNWTRPGGEWGTGWVFPTAGCWTIHAERGSGSGELAVRVAA